MNYIKEIERLLPDGGEILIEGRISKKQPEWVELILPCAFLRKIAEEHRIGCFSQYISKMWGNPVKGKEARFRGKEFSSDGESILPCVHSYLKKLFEEVEEVLAKDSGYQPLTITSRAGGRKEARKMRIIARHKVEGAIITESVDDALSTTEKCYRRFTATIRGWQKWKIFEGYVTADTDEQVVETVRQIRQRIDSRDEEVFAYKGYFLKS